MEDTFYLLVPTDLKFYMTRNSNVHWIRETIPIRFENTAEIK